MSRLTGTGSRSSFEPLDWLLVVIVGVTWGSAYLWIAIGLEALDPGLIACVRVALGAAALFLLPAARHRIGRRDWPLIAPHHRVPSGARLSAEGRAAAEKIVHETNKATGMVPGLGVEPR